MDDNLCMHTRPITEHLFCGRQNTQVNINKHLQVFRTLQRQQNIGPSRCLLVVALANAKILVPSHCGEGEVDRLAATCSP